MSHHVRAGLAIIVLVSAVARRWGLGFGDPCRQARLGETYIIDVARSCLRGEFSRPTEPPFCLLSRGLSAAPGTGDDLGVFQIGGRLWGHATGLVVALFLECGPFSHPRFACQLSTDAAMTFFIRGAIA